MQADGGLTGFQVEVAQLFFNQEESAGFVVAGGAALLVSDEGVLRELGCRATRRGLTHGSDGSPSCVSSCARWRPLRWVGLGTGALGETVCHLTSFGVVHFAGADSPPSNTGHL